MENRDFRGLVRCGRRKSPSYSDLIVGPITMWIVGFPRRETTLMEREDRWIDDLASRRAEITAESFSRRLFF